MHINVERLNTGIHAVKNVLVEDYVTKCGHFLEANFHPVIVFARPCCYIMLFIVFIAVSFVGCSLSALMRKSGLSNTIAIHSAIIMTVVRLLVGIAFWHSLLL
ncbi:hypothetical protein BCR42DRAFT_397930 [Absidia repens]|uniref:Uncharacterized protein n=1 Tax=Absidia repens TaxID=90262 RepID=A0A1X2HZY1_9FUNG|nr:hypothetical protein BCR42DRAFT_397930 [Absidia repens]